MWKNQAKISAQNLNDPDRINDFREEVDMGDTADISQLGPRGQKRDISNIEAIDPHDHYRTGVQYSPSDNIGKSGMIYENS